MSETRDCAASGPTNDEIHDGVLAAIIHVAAVSALGARDLVLEFDSARDAIGSGRAAGLRSTILQDAFRDGLSAEALKRLVRRHSCGIERLHPLTCGLDALRRADGDIDEYGRLVVNAVTAAARTRVGAGLLAGHVSHAKRSAIREVRAMLRNG